MGIEPINHVIPTCGLMRECHQASQRKEVSLASLYIYAKMLRLFYTHLIRIDSKIGRREEPRRTLHSPYLLAPRTYAIHHDKAYIESDNYQVY